MLPTSAKLQDGMTSGDSKSTLALEDDPGESEYETSSQCSDDRPAVRGVVQSLQKDVASFRVDFMRRCVELSV